MNEIHSMMAQAVSMQVISAKSWVDKRIMRGRSEVFGEAANIGPDIADLLLRNNPDNRPIVKSSLNRWKRALTTGAWQLNGETIKVARTGELNDGQHRLRAISETGVHAQVFIIWGLERDSRATIDTGAKRGGAHVLSMHGAVNANVLAAAIKVILNYRAEAHLSGHRENDEVLAAYFAMPGLPEILNLSKPLYSEMRGLPGGMVAGLHYIMAERHPAAAASFFNALNNGIGQSRTDPAVLLRHRLVQNMAAKAKLPMLELAAIFIKAFNAHVHGKQITQLKWAGVGEKAEPFPRII